MKRLVSDKNFGERLLTRPIGLDGRVGERIVIK
jgi:hypothetical protein